MVAADVLQNVFLIKYQNATGTCFRVSIDNKDFLITAKHIFPGLSNKNEVQFEIKKDTGWITIKSNLLLHKNNNIDIAVLPLNSNDLKIQFDYSYKYYLSEECYFVGYPYGLSMEGGQKNEGFPIPFVKKAIISAMTFDNNITTIFLDGHNNPGFSGGPVIVVDPANKKGRITKIIGIISAYKNDEKIIRTPIGDFKTSENSGIVISYSFKHVLEIIRD